MDKLTSYINSNSSYLLQIFASMGNDNLIQALKVFEYFQNVFNTKQIKLMQNGNNFLLDDNNAEIMENIIQEYYKTTKDGKNQKFYMYRVSFTFNQIVQIIKFLIKKDSTIQVVTQINNKPQHNHKAQHNHKGQANNKGQNISKQIKKKQIITNNEISEDKQSQKQENQFLPQIKDIPNLIQKYSQQIKKYQDRLETQQLNQIQIKQLNLKIKELKTKISFLQQRLNKKHSAKYQYQQNIRQSTSQLRNQNLGISLQLDSTLAKRTINRTLSPSKIEGQLKAIFQFYAKQLHLTGVKASFQRIEHQTSRINYQKLVHFLREFKIFPQIVKDQKKLLQIYVKYSSNTRDLTYQGFIKLLQKFAQIIYPQQDIQNKGQYIKQKIIQQRKKNKVLMNPFHSAQKQDFRIDQRSLKYQFKLLPLNGKDPTEIVSQLQQRRLIKKQLLSQRLNVQKVKRIRQLKKLQSIDPFHPEVQKNRHLIREKSVMEEQPVASLNNIQRYRDRKFDVKAMFGIQEDQQQNDHSIQSIRPYDNSIQSTKLQRMPRISNKSQDQRIKNIQISENNKLNNIMNGILRRSNGKIQRLGLSPKSKLLLN